MKKVTEEYAPQMDLTAQDRALTPTYNREPSSMLEIIAQLARDPNADVAKFSALLDLKERIDAKEAEQAYSDAMRRIQAKLPRISKDGKIEMGGKGAMKFATYENIESVVGPLLRDEGFSISFPSKPTNVGILLGCVLRHSRGHSDSAEMQLPSDTGPGRNALQALGSSLSYAKRYLLTGMLNIVTEGQDDGGKSAFPITDSQEVQLNDLMDGLEPADIAAFKKWIKTVMNADKFSQIQRDRFTEVISAIQTKRRQRGLS